MTTLRRSRLDSEIDALIGKIVQMGDLVDKALEKAIEALCERNAQQAREVIRGDGVINELRFGVERAVLTTIARQQPVAVDLRKLMASTHIAVELERNGDHAADIAYLTEHLLQEPEVRSLHELPRMAEQVRGMQKTAVHAFATLDEELARSVLARDDRVDIRYRQLIQKTLADMSDNDHARRATYLLQVGHELERVGDRSTNIAERVLFILDGEFVEEPSSYAWLD